MSKVTFIKPDYAYKPDDMGYELKTCPFCNALPSLDQDCDETWSVSCVNKRCFVLPITLSYVSKRQAVIAWNSRPGP